MDGRVRGWSAGCGWCVGLWILVGVGDQASQAATIAPPEFGPYAAIRPVGATVRTDEDVVFAPVSLFNGDGLTHRNPMMAEHGGDLDTLWRMPMEAADYPVSIEFDLGGEYLVSEMLVWQLPQELFPGQGVDQFEVIMRGAGGEEVGVLDSATNPLKAVGTQPVSRFNAFGECVFLPFPESVHFIELRIHRNLGDEQFVGIAEVMFLGREKLTAVPEPTSLSLAIIGWICAGQAGLRYRRRCRMQFDSCN